jgi:hypothetical protein
VAKPFGEAQDKRKKKGVAMPATRGLLYTLARWMGDFQAVRKGRVGQRVARRVIGRGMGRMLGRLFR